MCTIPSVLSGCCCFGSRWTERDRAFVLTTLQRRCQLLVNPKVWERRLQRAVAGVASSAIRSIINFQFRGDTYATPNYSRWLAPYLVGRGHSRRDPVADRLSGHERVGDCDRRVASGTHVSAKSRARLWIRLRRMGDCYNRSSRVCRFVLCRTLCACARMAARFARLGCDDLAASLWHDIDHWRSSERGGERGGSDGECRGGGG